MKMVLSLIFLAVSNVVWASQSQVGLTVTAKSLEIDDITITNLSSTSVDISWETNVDSDCEVKVWNSQSEFKASENEEEKDHSVSFSRLSPGKKYYYRISCGTDNQESESDRLSFQTKDYSEKESEDGIAPSENVSDEYGKIEIVSETKNDGEYLDSYREKKEVSDWKKVFDWLQRAGMEKIILAGSSLLALMILIFSLIKRYLKK